MIRDDDNKYGASFEGVAAGIELLATPYRAPRANAVCEQFLGSPRREYLDHVVILNERHWHLHKLVKGYKSTFDCARHHQGIEQCIACRMEQVDGRPVNARLSSQPVLNGLHHTYSWMAAQSVEHSQAQHPVYH